MKTPKRRHFNENRLENKINDEGLRQRLDDLKEAKARLFKKCIVPMVPQICKSHGCRRRTRICLMVICTLGLLYQVTEFVQLYLAFPTTLTIDIEYPDSILAPSFTFCNRGGLNKVKYCDSFSQHCINDSAGETQIKKEEARKILTSGKKELFEEFSTTVKETLFFQMTAWDAKDYLFENNTLTTVMLDEFGHRSVCHVFNHQIWEIQPRTLMIPSRPWDIHHFYRTTMQGCLYYDIHLIMEKNYGKAFTLNSPYQLENPFQVGVRFDTKGVDTFGLVLSEYYLLKHPYKTDCYDYIEMRKKNGEGPMSQQMCRDACIYEKTMEACACVPSHLLYPAPGRFCEDGDQNCLNTINTDPCYSKCKRDCVVYKYEFTTRKLSMETAVAVAMPFVTISLDKEPEFDGDPFSVDWKEVEMFAIAFKNTEKIVYRYMPKYTFIELFCYVGGYVGMWLAFSATDVADLIHIFWRWQRLRKEAHQAAAAAAVQSE